ncbi:polymorphic toxin type 44 domain-containing protein [Luteimonas sp. FCS-9]|uniref:polymorphic toxin type 44 domain-containing protein n=1 Tax=Luteimonas sp. FCS-9 TaxID=1547516 RepID=UPI000AD541C3|nr:polymorphic toxin type 44 domain-containing protein [Luteimonas sp. FCS-9]
MTNVDSAVNIAKDRLEQGIFDWDVTKGDLDDITAAVVDLTPRERNEFISRLSDDDIKNWTQEIDGLNGSLSANERADLFNALAEGMDATQMTRFVQAFDGSSSGRVALADAVATHGSIEAKTGLIEATRSSINSEYSATQGTWGNAETAAIGNILASLEGDPAAFEQAVGSLSPDQLQDVMSVAMGRRYIADFSGMTAGTTSYDPATLTGILGAAEGTDLATRTAIFEAAMPQLATMQGDNAGLLGAASFVDDVAQAMGQVMSREEAAAAGLVNTPEAPPAMSIDDNIAEAQTHGFPQDLPWFYEQVKGRAEWDYKQQGAQYENFGNFHYGVVAAAMGIPEDVALRAAGYAQTQADTSRDEWGNPYDLGGSYGDDPADQQQIKDGYDYYNAGLHRVWPD